MINPINAGRIQPIPISKNGRYFSPNEMINLANDVFKNGSGLALTPSINDAIIVKKIVNRYTIFEWLNNGLTKVNKIIVMANG